MLTRWNRKFEKLLHNPLKVFWVVGGMTLLLLLFNGSIWRFWSLLQNQKQMVTRVMNIEEKSKRLDFEILEAKKLTYIERQATDQFDFVREGDLIFIFSE